MPFNLTDAEYAQLSEYEQKRLANIARNTSVLKKLGLKKIQPNPLSSTPSSSKSSARSPVTRKKRAAIAKPASTGRRSKRLKGVKPVDYTSEKVVLPAAETVCKNEHGEPVSYQERQAQVKKETTESTLAKSLAWLQESRAQFIEEMGGVKLEVSDEAHMWRHRAIQRWGTGVCVVENHDEQSVDWEQYVLSRMSTPSPESPMGLLQERYASCPWRLLIACCLMSRVSSASVKEKAISTFFSAYATPTDAMNAEPEDVLSIIAPLGLFENRFKSIISISQQFLSMHPTFEVGMTKELKIYGCGQFTVDSFYIFARDQGGSMMPGDKNLAAYCRWRRTASSCEDDGVHGSCSSASKSSKEPKAETVAVKSEVPLSMGTATVVEMPI